MPLRLISRDGYTLVVRPEKPDWLAASVVGAAVLERLAAGEDQAEIARSFCHLPGLDCPSALRIVRNFARETRRIWGGDAGPEYRGRGAYLTPAHLRELWLHVNDRCNFACRHCLVSGGPGGSDGLPTSDLLGLIAEARELGVKTFFVTGGEPFLRDDLPDLLTAMLADPEAHAVVLTNGSLLGDALLVRLSGLDRERLHLQVSFDAATPDLNDRLRSPGAFAAASDGIRNALRAGLDVTVATVVLAENLDDLPALVTLLAQLGVKSQHLMWQHLRERGARERRAVLDDLITGVLALKDQADRHGVLIDNFENYRAVANGQAGIKRDLTNACWDSLAIGPDGSVYPSASLVGIAEFRGGSALAAGLRSVWLESPLFSAYRLRTALDRSSPEQDALLFLHGGGDPEHAFFFSRLTGGAEEDPYVPLYRAMIYRVIDEVVAAHRVDLSARDDLPFTYQLMGQDGLGCPIRAGAENSGPHLIDFAHSNCVLIQDVIGHSRRIVQEYYGEAATTSKTEICCSALQGGGHAAHLPAELLDRSYGCGSPVLAAGLAEGHTVVDLGSGTGIECFIAAKLVGSSGRVVGVDMTPDMLAVANRARAQVAQNLGYSNTAFVRGYLEALPLAEGTVDVVISNCVINLSPEKLKVFSEIRRVLRPGGRMVIADVVAEEEVTDRVRYNPRLKAECIGGALVEEELLILLSKLGFDRVRIESRAPYREVDGVRFFSDTVIAERANASAPLPYAVDLGATVAVAYCCPPAACCDTPVVEAACRNPTSPREAPGRGEPATAAPAKSSVCCDPPVPPHRSERHTEGCAVCGQALEYLETPQSAECYYCGRTLRTRACCIAGHYVCDRCHGGDYLRFVRSYIAQCELTDPVAVFSAMREQFPFPLHGPEHHAMVPAAFLTAYRNSGGEIDPKAIDDAVSEGARLPGGTCAYWGGCSAALGMGVAYSAVLHASPLRARGRSAAQAIVARILQRLSDLKAPRCCRRESIIALQVGAECSADLLPHPIAAGHPLCTQASLNRECIGKVCPFHG